MSKRTLEPPRLGIAAAYFIFFTLVLWPVTDFLTTALPFQWGRVEWRYASVGLMAVYVFTPIMGIGMAMVLAFFLRHRLILRSLSVVCLAGAIFFVLAILSLGLDVIQLRGIVTPEGMPSLKVGGVIAGVKHLSAITALALLGVGGFQASRQLSNLPSGKEAADRAPWLGSKPERAQDGKP